MAKRCRVNRCGATAAVAAWAAVALSAPLAADAADRTAIRPPYRGAGGSAEPVRPGCPTDDMYPARPESVHAEVVETAGGADAVAGRARELLNGGDSQRALHMSDMALRAEGENRAALEVRRDAVQTLLAGAVNLNERGWLTAALREVEAKLD